MPDRQVSIGSASEHSVVAWWRIVPKRSAPDIYRRHYFQRDVAELILRTMRKRRRYKITEYNIAGKRLNT